MAFSLRNWIGNEVNTAKQAVGNNIAQVMPTHAQAPAAQLPTKGQSNFSVGLGVLRPGVQAMPQPVAPPHPSLMHDIGAGLKDEGIGIGLRGIRSGIGAAQGISGLVDEAGRLIHQNNQPDATSRVSKALNSAAQNVDKTAAQQGRYGRDAYKVMAPATDALMFAGPGEALRAAGLGAKVAEAGKAVEPTTNLVSKASGAIQSGLSDLSKGNAGQRILGSGLGGIASREGAANIVGNTGLGIGTEASKGQAITGKDAAMQLAMNTALAGGIPAASQGLKEAAPALVKGAKGLNKEIQASSAKKALAANYDATIAGLQKQKADLQQRIQGTTNFRGIETTQKHIDQLDSQIAQTAANKPKLSLKDRVLAPNVGLSMKAVTGHEDLTPDQHEFIGQYADMLKSMGQGNGVDLIPGQDGGKIRASNNYRDPSLGKGRITNGQWFDHARKEIESGKAAYGASDEYKALSQAKAPATPDLSIPNIPGAKTPFDTPEIIQKRAEQAAVQSTHTDMSPDRVALRERVGQMLHQQGGHSDANKAPLHIDSNKQAHLVLGPPASGKTNIVDPLLHQHNARLIDSDEAKALLGDVNQAGALHQESDHIVNGNMIKAIKNGDNIVHPLVGKNKQKVLDIANHLKDQGYDVHLHYNHLDPHLTAGRAVSRFNETGRFVDPDYVYNQIGLKPKQTYDTIKNNEAFTTHTAYDNNVPRGEKPRLVEAGTNTSGSQRELNGGSSEQSLSQKEVTRPTAPASPAKQSPVQPKPSVKGLSPASKETGGVSSANSTKQRGFVTSVKASDEVSGKTKQMTTGKYTPRSTAKLQASAEQVAGGDLNKATQDVQSALERKVGTINDKDVANSIAVAKAHDAAGNVQQSSDIYEKLAEHLTKQGQSIQAASLLSHQTPEGLQYGAQKALKKVGVELTPKVQGKLKGAIDEVRNAKPGTERDYAVKKLQKIVSDYTPTGTSDKISSIWKAGLLTGVKTQTGNWLSNGTFQALHAASNPLAVGIDKAISKFTGVRTKSLTNKGLASGLGEGISKAGKYLKTGIDERKAIDNKYDTHGEINFKNKALKTYVNGVFRLMGAADRPTYYSQLRNSLHDLALTDAANKGIPKEQLATHVEQFVTSPPPQAFQTATNEAEKAVLGNDTALSNIIGGVRQSVQRIDNPLARGTANAAVNFIAPFTKVPSAFLNRVIDFSPVGAVKEAGMQIAAGKLDQRVLATALSEATTGTAMTYLGYQAAKHGLLSGNYPTGDSKEVQRWKADGIQPNSIKVGDKWLSLNYFGPLGLLFNAGQRVNDSSKQGDNKAGQAVAAVSGAPKDLMGQSFLQGLSGFTNAVNDPTRSAKTYINSQGSSIVPTIVGDVANATDKMQRQADTLGQTIQSKIPGARQALNPKQDVYGNPLQAKTSGVNQLANPLRPSSDLSKDSPVLTEVNRLHNADVNNKDLQVTPTAVQKVVTVDGTKVKLNDQQAYALQKEVGQTTQANWGKLISTPEYKALDDAGKAKALSNLRTDSAALATRQYVVNNNLGTYSKGVTTKQGNLSSGGDVSSYTQGSGSTTAISPKIDKTSQQTLTKYNAMNADDRKKAQYSDPAFDYKYEQAKYNNDLASGKLSKAQQITQRDAVNKAKVGSSFSKDTRDLYGLSKQEVYNLITTDPNGKKIASDLLAYGDALKSAGIESNKFRTKAGDENFGDGTNSATSGSKASGASTAGLRTAYSSGTKLSQSLRSIAEKASMKSTKGGSKSMTINAKGMKKTAVKMSGIVKSKGSRTQPIKVYA